MGSVLRAKCLGMGCMSVLAKDQFSECCPHFVTNIYNVGQTCFPNISGFKGGANFKSECPRLLQPAP